MELIQTSDDRKKLKVVQSGSCSWESKETQVEDWHSGVYLTLPQQSVWHSKATNSSVDVGPNELTYVQTNTFCDCTKQDKQTWVDLFVHSASEFLFYLHYWSSNTPFTEILKENRHLNQRCYHRWIIVDVGLLWLQPLTEHTLVIIFISVIFV